MSGEVPDALTELIRVLRDQLAQKDERIAWLEARLKEASALSAEQNRRLDALAQRISELVEALERQQHRLEQPATSQAHAPPPSVPDGVSVALSPEEPAPPPVRAQGAPPTGPLGTSDLPPPEAEAAAAEQPPPDLSDAIQAIATTVVQAAQRKAEEESEVSAEEEKEITARIARKDLQRGHKAQGAKRGIWPFRQRPDRSG